MDLKSAAAESTISGLASKATTAGGAMALYGGLAANEWAAFGGLGIAGIGLVLNWIYKHRTDVRDRELHMKRLARLDEAEE